MSGQFPRNSFGSCCNRCDPCCMPYEQSSESCFGTEVEAIPQSPPAQQPLFTCGNVSISKKNSAKQNKVKLLMVESKRINNFMKLPRTHITRKVKSDVLYSSWECCKRNGIQDETPQWLVLGKPYRRPGPSYRCRVAYYPTCNYQCY